MLLDYIVQLTAQNFSEGSAYLVLIFSCRPHLSCFEYDACLIYVYFQYVQGEYVKIHKKASKYESRLRDTE